MEGMELTLEADDPDSFDEIINLLGSLFGSVWLGLGRGRGRGQGLGDHPPTRIALRLGHHGRLARRGSLTYPHAAHPAAYPPRPRWLTPRCS
jgi:hypothetical protein